MCVKNWSADPEALMNAAANETSCSETEHEKTGVEAQTSSTDHLVDVIAYVHCCDYQPCSHVQLTHIIALKQ